MLVEMGTGRTRPMRRKTPVCSSASRQWDGFLVEEHAPTECESSNVSLLTDVVYLTLEDRTDLEWRSDGQTVSKLVQPGQISILPASHPYSVKLRAAGGSVVVSLEPKLLTGAAAEQGVFGEVELVWVHGVDDTLLRELVLALRSELRGTPCDHPAYAQSLASALAAHVVRRYSTDRLRLPRRPGGLTVPTLRATVQFIHENLAGEISIEQLALRANLSAAHFARMFKQSTGLSPHQYLLHCRVARARQLLAGTPSGLAEVASLTGFCDQGHLTRSFRQLLGTTPGAYSRRLHESRRRKSLTTASKPQANPIHVSLIQDERSRSPIIDD
jgi:AraC family transcriptional regulator